MYYICCVIKSLTLISCSFLTKTPSMVIIKEVSGAGLSKT